MPGQILFAAPVIVAGVAGILYTANVRFELKPKQFCERTIMVPLTPKFEAKAIVTVGVPCPETIVALVGAVH